MSHSYIRVQECLKVCAHRALCGFRKEDTKMRMFSAWCWERSRTRGEGDDRGWDGRMASPTLWTWVWASSGSWWWTGRPGVLWSTGSPRVGQDIDMVDDFRAVLNMKTEQCERLWGQMKWIRTGIRLTYPAPSVGRRKHQTHRTPVFSYNLTKKVEIGRTSLAFQWPRIRFLRQGARVPSLTGDLRYHIPRGAKTKTSNTSSIVTNSIKSFFFFFFEKWFTLKKKSLKRKGWNLVYVCLQDFIIPLLSLGLPCSAGDPGLIPGSERFPGEGNGNPLQFSCLEDPMDRGAWRFTVYRVTKSRMWLKRLSRETFPRDACQPN